MSQEQDWNIDRIERRYLAFKPIIIMLQSLFAGLIALFFVTIASDIYSRIIVHRTIGEWPPLGAAVQIYGASVVLLLGMYLLARWSMVASSISIRILAILLGTVLTAELIYGASRFLGAFQLNQTFAIEWLPFAIVGVYLLTVVWLAGVLAFRTDKIVGRTVSLAPDGSVFSWQVFSV